ncbi:predicted protein [Chaetomium globosum CBS 148.51]|uniref:Uncharacterized protein n=1 Tax=Chaetomium globosum (strain ATCC 6205 / CBS 148.51 / DSM 1962 / NBRC 6347 / NRRL 1970) TaxID=306901 RepID=Q2GNY1_CHAGB|nr:uncharacterized protein CHGG_10323 [Chaetomium globosum CBS 148.51]EAQ83919.1 predicted protein [Chaetomium globosum CBS 148.51]
MAAVTAFIATCEVTAEGIWRNRVKPGYEIWADYSRMEVHREFIENIVEALPLAVALLKQLRRDAGDGDALEAPEVTREGLMEEFNIPHPFIWMDLWNRTQASFSDSELESLLGVKRQRDDANGDEDDEDEEDARPAKRLALSVKLSAENAKEDQKEQYRNAQQDAEPQNDRSAAASTNQNPPRSATPTPTHLLMPVARGNMKLQMEARHLEIVDGAREEHLRLGLGRPRRSQLSPTTTTPTDPGGTPEHVTAVLDQARAVFRDILDDDARAVRKAEAHVLGADEGRVEHDVAGVRVAPQHEGAAARVLGRAREGEQEGASGRGWCGCRLAGGSGVVAVAVARWCPVGEGGVDQGGFVQDDAEASGGLGHVAGDVEREQCALATISSSFAGSLKTEA